MAKSNAQKYLEKQVAVAKSAGASPAVIADLNKQIAAAAKTGIKKATPTGTSTPVVNQKGTLEYIDNQINQLLYGASGSGAGGIAGKAAPGYQAPSGETVVEEQPGWYIDYLNKREEDAATSRTSAFDLARQLAEEYGIGASIADAVIDMVANKGYTPQAVRLSIRDTEEYKTRFSGLEQYKARFNKEIEAGRKAAAPTPEQYIQYELQYQEILNRYGMMDLANRALYADLIGKDVSPYEVNDRVTKAIDKINNADDVLKQQLKTYFPTFGTTDFAKALLTGSNPEDMAGQLERRFKRAEISSEMSRFGFKPKETLAQELETLGVTREEARTGFGKLSEQLQPTEKLAQIYEGTSAGIEEELTAEQFKGLQSQRRKRLLAQEKGAFSGASGLSTTSLQTGTAGSF
jgi:hypothetical protein